MQLSSSNDTKRSLRWMFIVDKYDSSLVNMEPFEFLVFVILKGMARQRRDSKLDRPGAYHRLCAGTLLFRSFRSRHRF